jgi:hypothetical protein
MLIFNYVCIDWSSGGRNEAHKDSHGRRGHRIDETTASLAGRMGQVDTVLLRTANRRQGRLKLEEL